MKNDVINEETIDYDRVVFFDPLFCMQIKKNRNEKSETHFIMDIRSFVHCNFIISLAKCTYFLINFGQPLYKKFVFFLLFYVIKKE